MAEPTPLDMIAREGRVRIYLGYTMLGILPLLLMLLVLATKFQGLQDPDVLDHAQLARNIAGGHGFVTKVIRPLSVRFKPQMPDHPDLYNAPVFPYVLAMFYKAMSPTEHTTGVCGAILWIASLWVTFLVGRSLMGGRAAAVGTAFYALSSAMITAAVGGFPEPLLAMEILAVLWLIFPRAADDAPDAADLPYWRALLAGVATGLVMLTHYSMVVLILVVIGYLVMSQSQSLRIVPLFLLGVAVALLPWVWRNLKEVGSPFFSLYWFEIMSHTLRHPGDTVWRTMTLHSGPVGFAFSHPRELFRKLSAGFTQYRSGVIGLVDPVIAFLFLVNLFGGDRDIRRRRLVIVVTAGVGLGTMATWLLSPEPKLLLAWLPVLAIVAGAELYNWIQYRIGRVTFPGFPVPRSMQRVTRFGRDAGDRHAVLRVTLPAVWGRLLVYVAVLGLVGLPLLLHLTTYSPGPDPAQEKKWGLVKSLIPKGALVMTDQPIRVAWYTKLPSVWLLQQEDDWEVLDASGGRVEAVFIMAPNEPLPEKERGPWWGWVMSTRGNYRDLISVRSSLRSNVVRVRKTDEKPSPDLEAMRDEAQKDSGSIDAHLRLARELYNRERLREAYEEFRAAVLLDRSNSEAVLGMRQTSIALDDPGNTLGVAQRALQMNPADPAGKLALEQAGQTFERALGRFPKDSWLLLHCALIQSRLKRWEQAEDYYRRLAKSAPKSFSPRLLIGNMYMQQGLMDEAATEFERFVEEQRNNAMAHEALGGVRWKQGRQTEALAEFTEAARLRPDWSVAYQQMGFANLGLKNYAAATANFKKSLQINHRSPPCQLGLAQALALDGKLTEAIAQYESLVADSAKHPGALNSLIDLYFRTKAYDRALPTIQRAIAADPKNPILHDALGWTYSLMGNYDAALAELRQLAEKYPKNVQIQYHLGKIYLAAGQKADAIRTLRTALTLGLAAEDKADAEAVIAAEEKPQ